MARRFCTEVTPQCPVEYTTYGYRPNLGGNAVLVAVFALCAIAQLGLGVRAKLRAFTSVMFIGTFLEAAGYGGRIIMNGNPWSSSGFKLQIVALVLAPSFLAAGIYLTLKHLVMFIGPEHSRLRPKLYTWIFIGCDGLSIVTQAVGGGVAATENPDLLDTGNGLIVAGIALQVATMFVCLLCAADFAWAVWKHHSKDDTAETTPTYHRLASRGFQFYLGASALAFVLIWIRCIYRIPEMSGGWGNPLMQNEREFMILDGMMIAIASILMSVAHPGIFFPAISSRYQYSTHSSESAESGEESIVKA